VKLCVNAVRLQALHNLAIDQKHASLLRPMHPEMYLTNPCSGLDVGENIDIVLEGEATCRLHKK
jgi:hypothetical protein